MDGQWIFSRNTQLKCESEVTDENMGENLRNWIMFLWENHFFVKDELILGKASFSSQLWWMHDVFNEKWF